MLTKDLSQVMQLYHSTGTLLCTNSTLYYVCVQSNFVEDPTLKRAEEH